MSVNQSQIQYGGEMMIFVNPTGTTSNGSFPVAFATSAKLTVNLSTREISSKDSADWKEFAGGKFDWTASSEHLMSYTGLTGSTLSLKTVYTAFVAKSPIFIALATTTGTTPSWTMANSKINLSGQAMITAMDFNAPDNENGTYSISLQGTGTLSIS
jgi:predicted secreted protein